MKPRPVGRPRIGRRVAEARLDVIVSAESLRRYTKAAAAGGVSLAQWVRNACGQSLTGGRGAKE